MSARHGWFTASVLLLITATPFCVAQDIERGPVLLADSFDRFGEPTSDLGDLPQGGKLWGKRLGARDGTPIEGLVRGRNGELVIGYSSGNRPCDCGVYVEDFAIADAVISLTVGPSHMKDRPHTACISYRAADPQAAAGGYEKRAYHVELTGDWSGVRDVVLRYGPERLAVADIAQARSREASHQVRVAFAGCHHQVWLDGNKAIDFWETEGGRNAAGHVGFGGWYSIGSFDDFELGEAEPTGVLPTIDTSGGRIAPLMFRGRPFFVLGTYDPPGEDDLAEWRQAGGNAVIVAVMRQTESPEQRQAKLRELADWGAERDVAMVYYPLIDFYSRDGDQTVPTRPEEIQAKTELLEEMLAITSQHPQTLGYWTFDEIENHLYKAYGDWDKKKDQGLAQWIAGAMSWTYDALKARDPDAYVMPTIAWWTTYKDLAPLYDVNVPNQYPTKLEDEPLRGPLYQVAYDAVCAADAIRATGRTSFVYMPGIFDTIMEPWRAPTRRELRYLYFAPITQGAMGILAWRLGRCSMDYRRAVVYPLMRDVKRFIPWLLGEWRDEKVTSNCDVATAAYLKKLPKRVREVAGEEDAGTTQTDAVPDCSHMLRRRPNNSYLLLAVNNRVEPLNVVFTISDMRKLPGHALEMLDYRRVAIRDGQIEDTLEPFGVRAYVFEPD